jgi:hypothetical protein
MFPSVIPRVVQRNNIYTYDWEARSSRLSTGFREISRNVKRLSDTVPLLQGYGIALSCRIIRIMVWKSIIQMILQIPRRSSREEASHQL